MQKCIQFTTKVQNMQVLFATFLQIDNPHNFTSYGHSRHCNFRLP